MAHRSNALTESQIEAIAAIYDGRTETIDKLVKRFGVPRHRITRAAAAAGYRPGRKRVAWTFERDDVIRRQWGRLPIEQIAEMTGATAVACRLRAKRLGVSSRDFEDLAIKDLEAYTGIDHRQWHFYREKGWLKTWAQPRVNATPVTRVSLRSLHALLRKKPEIYDYRRAGRAVRAVLGLNKLPDPPRYKKLTCRSDHWNDGLRATLVGGRYGAEQPTLEDRLYTYTLPSCEANGGTSFWAPLYASDVACPRCGCKVSRYSEDDGAYSNDDHGEGDALESIAGKLGLKWTPDGLFNAAGERVQDEKLLRCVFSGRGSGSKAFSAFRRLLEGGLDIKRANPVPDERWLDDLTGYALKADQKEAFDEFRRTGRVGVYIPPGRGKSALARYIMTRLEGRHVVFVSTKVLQEDWINAFRTLPTRVEQRLVHHPHTHAEITVYDKQGEVRCRVDIFNYRTRNLFRDTRYVCRVFDEAHFLPGHEAVTLLYRVDAEYQLSITATPFREDGRSSMIDVVSASTVGDDWSGYRERREIPDVPVTVVIVPEGALKVPAVANLIDRRERTLIFSDSIAAGRRLEDEMGIPFVFSGTKQKLKTITESRTVAVSRTADCGLSVRDVEHVVELTFHKGSRAQSLQRHGRLLHSQAAKRHTVLMTPEELSRHFKRLTALEMKGCRMQIKLMTGRNGRPSVVTPLRLKQRKVPAIWCDILPKAA